MGGHFEHEAIEEETFEKFVPGYNEDYDEGLLFHVEYEYSTEDDTYGEDADGNRGMPVTYIYVDKIYVYDENGNDVTDQIPDKEMKHIESYAEDHAERNYDGF